MFPEFPVVCLDGNVLMYGHLDKQPEMDGWDKGMGPWKPVVKNKKLRNMGKLLGIKQFVKAYKL